MQSLGLQWGHSLRRWGCPLARLLKKMAAGAVHKADATSKVGMRSSVTFKDQLQNSASAPLMDATSISQSERIAAPVASSSGAGVSWTQFHLFLFPSNLEHPESTGRLELFARYGPVDSDGRLRGGIGGSHVHTDLEIRQMIAHETREMLFALFKKPRATVEVIVDSLMPAALDQNYTWAEVRKLLRHVPVDSDGRLNFAVAQKVILENQRRRLQDLLKEGGTKKERGPRVPFQSKAAEMLMATTRRKKLNEQEEQLAKTKRTANYCTLVATLQDQTLTNQLVSNVTLCRGLGRVDDRWDRYCALRRVGKASYIQARNHPHAGVPCIDDGLADKHAGCSSLVAAMLAR